MKKTILGCFVFLFPIINASAQATFLNVFISQMWEEMYDAVLTSDSGYIMIGYTESMGAGSSDLYLIRTNAAGDTLWTGAYGGTNAERGYSVRETFDGGFIAAGNTGSFGATNGNVYIIKIDANGNLLWSKRFESSGNDHAYSISETADSGFIITGSTTFNQGTEDVFLIRTNSLGDTLWTKCYSKPDWDFGYSVIQGNDGAFVLTGKTHNGFSNSDIFLLKANASGNILWSNSYGGNDYEYGSMVQQTPDSGFVIAASSRNISTNYDFTLLKTNSSGNATILKIYEGAGDDQAKSLLQTTDGGYLLAGYATILGNGRDAYLIRTDVYGDPIWTKTFGGYLFDEIASVLPAAGGGFVHCGHTMSFMGGVNHFYMVKADGSGFSGCYDSTRALPNLLPGYSQTPTGFIELPFAPAVVNTPTVASKGITIVQNVCLYDGVAESEKSDFKIYPNPTIGQFTVVFDKVIEEGCIEVSNMLGKTILKVPITNELQKEAYLENTEAGIYFLTVRSNGSQYVQKIILQ